MPGSYAELYEVSHRRNHSQRRRIRRRRWWRNSINSRVNGLNQEEKQEKEKFHEEFFHRFLHHHQLIIVPAGGAKGRGFIHLLPQVTPPWFYALVKVDRPPLLFSLVALKLKLNMKRHFAKLTRRPSHKYVGAWKNKRGSTSSSSSSSTTTT